jgi:cytochrome c
VGTRRFQWRAATVIAAVMAFAAGAGMLAQNPPARQSVWDGVYTEAQAARGERQYGRSCESCHGPDMSGDQVEEIPSLVLDSFMTDWNGKSVRELFETVKRSMPKDKPGTLGTSAYVNVIAYMLQANKFPSGPKELSRTPEQLESIVIERAKAR